MTQKHHILISACLLGDPVRYDAQSKPLHHPLLQGWLDQSLLIKMCPEVSGGLNTPRPAAEIMASSSKLIIATENQHDVTEAFMRGATKTLELCKKHNIHIAILSESSPSCGSNTVYDGSFTRTKIPGAGITTQCLRDHGIQVFNQFELELAQAAFNKICNTCE